METPAPNLRVLPALPLPELLALLAEAAEHTPTEALPAVGAHLRGGLELAGQVLRVADGQVVFLAQSALRRPQLFYFSANDVVALRLEPSPALLPLLSRGALGGPAVPSPARAALEARLAEAGAAHPALFPKGLAITAAEALLDDAAGQAAVARVLHLFEKFVAEKGAGAAAALGRLQGMRVEPMPRPALLLRGGTLHVATGPAAGGFAVLPEGEFEAALARVVGL